MRHRHVYSWGSKLWLPWLRGADDPATYVLYEKWKSVDALASHMKESHTVAFLKVIRDATSGTELKVMVPVE